MLSTRKRYTTNFRCEWCGRKAFAKRADAKTCSPGCRLQISRYIAQTGFPPDVPPGNVTYSSAVAALTKVLFAREAARRSLLGTLLQQEDPLQVVADLRAQPAPPPTPAPAPAPTPGA